MSQKTLYYAQLAKDTARHVTGDWQRWVGFLAIAGRLYKYPYPDQLMIYAQRPDATACASYEVWNDRMNRYVKRGTKGIALLDDAGDRLRLRYVFDLADTGTRPNSRVPWLWTLEDRHAIPVAAMLERRYGTVANDLPQQFADVAGMLADDYWANHGHEVRGILARTAASFLYCGQVGTNPQGGEKTGSHTAHCAAPEQGQKRCGLPEKPHQLCPKPGQDRRW